GTLTVVHVAAPRAVRGASPCTPIAPTNPCAPGGGLKKTDCVMEWLFTPVPLIGKTGTPIPEVKNGIPKNRLRCYEGDTRCDTDPDLSNKSCTLQAAICINNPDLRFPNCTPTDIQFFEVKKPNPNQLMDSIDGTNLTTLEDQGGGGAGGFAVTVVKGSVTKFSGAPNSANICSAPLSFLGPLKTTKTSKIVQGRRPLRIKGTTSALVTDSDGLTLECRPSTCGDGIIDKNHETCDDGNRTNNDGCNQACQVEAGYSCSGQPSTCVPFTPTLPVSSTPTVTDTPTVTPTRSDTPTG